MLLPSDSLHIAFAQIKKAAKAHPEDPSFVSTLLLATMEADSVCATKLLCDALKLENVMFSLQPVSGFEDVDRILPGLLRDGSFLSIILINCGGTVDLTKRFGEELLEGVYIYVMDSHRPLHHANLHMSAGRVLVFGGEIQELDESVPAEDDEEDVASSDEEEEQAEAEEENNQLNEQGQELEEELEGSRTGSDHGEGAVVSPSGKRKKEAESPTRKRARRDLVKRYYRASYIGDPAAHVAYSLLQQLGRASKFSSWVAIVGITSRYISMDLDDDTYLQLVEAYREIVRDQNLSVRKFRQSLDGKTSILAPQREQVDYVENEVRLVLYRHWSLLEACYNTEYFAARFGSWSAETSGELERFLAKLGLSLRDANQKHSFISKESKDLIKNSIKSTAEHYEYTRMTFPSFCFRTGFDKEVSAEDAGRFVSALLDDAETGLRMLAPGSEFQAKQTQGFNVALELLSKNQPELLNRALQTAQRHARLLTAETIAVIQGGLVQNAGDFRWAMIELHEDDDDREGQGTARALFYSCPANVIRLAKHIINANQGNQRWIKANTKPLVLAVVRKGRALVTGVPCPPEVGEVVPNPFGKLFRQTAREIHMDVNPHQFLDSFVIELNAEDVQRFLLTLTSVITG